VPLFGCDNAIGTVEPGGAHVASSAAIMIPPADDARDHLRTILSYPPSHEWDHSGNHTPCHLPV